jgi:hypothetical protein
VINSISFFDSLFSFICSHTSNSSFFELLFLFQFWFVLNCLLCLIVKDFVCSTPTSSWISLLY